MDKLIIIILITIVTILYGCSTPQKKDINKMLDIKVEEGLKDAKAKDLPQLIITQKIINLLRPLFWALFISIILIVSGVRIIGFGVLLASLACILFIITMAVYLKLIAVIVIVILLVGLFFLGKNLYDNYRFKKDLVKTVEISKNFISEEDKETLSKRLDVEQSKATKQVVKDIKNKTKEQ